MVIRSSLSTEARNVLEPKPMVLYQELVSQYSAMSGSRKAALLQDMWSIKANEGEDPKPYMAKIRSSHAQISAGGMALSDEIVKFERCRCDIDRVAYRGYARVV